MSTNPSNSSAEFAFGPDMLIDMLLRAYGPGETSPTPAEVREQAESLAQSPALAHLRAQIDHIVAEVMRRIDVRIGTASLLEDAGGHEPWVDAAPKDAWQLWPRLNAFLREHERLPISVLAELDRSTDQVLDQLESPHRHGRWDRRGLVVGHVQSGKTTHYVSLAAKAIDAGYRVVIIFAGVHNSLRSQTHDRVDRQLIGRDSTAVGLEGGQPRIFGVGEYSRRMGLAEVPFAILTCTNSANNGDFNARTASQVWLQVNAGARLVMVVKKNATILRSLRSWLQNLLGAGNSAQSQELIHHATLFIDDEADHASVNTRDADQDPTVINGLIRQLLMSFARVGFIGYTATPFANIFMDSSDAGSATRYGADLFPRSFIAGLKAPSDYIGPQVVFGHPGDESVGLSPQEPLPMYTEVTDAAAWIPSPHKKDHRPGPLAQSVKQAVQLFLVACAGRHCRGDEKSHNSMLIHATRFVAVQNRIAEQVEEYLGFLRAILSHGSAASKQELTDDLKQLWDSHCVVNHESFVERLGAASCPPLPDWAAVRAVLPVAANKVRVMKINGSSDDALAYARAENGLSVIAIGGDKLSRGLTLEGLSVSYFLRTSSMYDTLMQMGRWFGYRPRYADMCRVFTTRDLYEGFREIALAIDDLRAELDRMAAAHRTPLDFGLRVRTPSDGLLITAANKLRRGETIQVRYDEKLLQALHVPKSGLAAERNRMSFARLIEGLGTPVRTVRQKETPHHVWVGVSPSKVVEFLTDYEAYRTHSFLSNCEQLRRYIGAALQRDELTDWTVVVVSKQRGATTPTIRVGGNNFITVERNPDRDAVTRDDRYAMRAVCGRDEEAADLSIEQYADALGLTPAEHGSAANFPSREAIRAVRPAKRGLLLLYPIVPSGADADNFVLSACVSFPRSQSSQPLAYTVNEVWQREYGLSQEDADDDTE